MAWSCKHVYTHLTHMQVVYLIIWIHFLPAMKIVWMFQSSKYFTLASLQHSLHWSMCLMEQLPCMRHVMFQKCWLTYKCVSTFLHARGVAHNATTRQSVDLASCCVAESPHPSPYLRALDSWRAGAPSECSVALQDLGRASFLHSLCLLGQEQVQLTYLQ